MKRTALIVGLIATHVLAFILGDLSWFRRAITIDATHGRFVGRASLSPIQPAGFMQLNEDFIYIDPSEEAWLAPAASKVNGASIPRSLWTLVGSPFSGYYLNASIVHDVYCETMERPSDDVHRMFFDACLAGGVSESDAKRLYWAVQRFGPKWEHIYEEKTATYLNSDGHEMVRSYQVRKTIPLESEEMSEADIAWMNSYFDEHDPEVDVIPTLQPGDMRAPPRLAPELDVAPPPAAPAEAPTQPTA